MSTQKKQYTTKQHSHIMYVNMDITSTMKMGNKHNKNLHLIHNHILAFYYSIITKLDHNICIIVLLNEMNLQLNLIDVLIVHEFKLLHDLIPTLRWTDTLSRLRFYLFICGWEQPVVILTRIIWWVSNEVNQIMNKYQTTVIINTDFKYYIEWVSVSYRYARASSRKCICSWTLALVLSSFTTTWVLLSPDVISPNNTWKGKHTHIHTHTERRDK